VIEFFDRMAIDSAIIAKELNKICEDNGFMKSGGRVLVTDIDKKLLQDYFCLGRKTKKFDEIIETVLLHKPELLRNNVFIKNMCLFLRNPSLIHRNAVKAVFNAFSYKISSIIFNNIQTQATPLFSENEFIVQVLK
jgi:hypothetical protein